jgi:PPM family protein phosphatase
VLRIAEHWHGSDRGRQRQGNEDSLFVRSPLFVVADGMGGAQAGEVASEMAVDSFDGGLPDGSPADGLVKLIEDANRRIHERSRAEAQRAGMGTTVTAAYLSAGEVTIGHVGDSRAYLLRDGDLIRLTRDHSLVGELVARGKLTEEQAEAHPQRSVITRSVGPEPEVQVDTHVYQARAGDTFLVCSDGLTSMITDAHAKEILESAGSLDEAGRELIAAANQAGGRDNITVILFRVEDVDGPAAEAETGQTAEFAGEAASAGDETEAAYRRSSTVALPALAVPEPAPEPPPRTAPPPPEARRPKRRRRRIPGGLIFAVAAVALVAAGLWTASRAVYFVGTNPDTNAVTIYQGVPYELPFGIELYTPSYTSGVRLQQIPERRRATFTDHKWRSKNDAEDLVAELERGRIQ